VDPGHPDRAGQQGVTTSQSTPALVRAYIPMTDKARTASFSRGGSIMARVSVCMGRHHQESFLLHAVPGDLPNIEAVRRRRLPRDASAGPLADANDRGAVRGEPCARRAS